MLKVPASAERAIWGLVRACISAGGHLRRVAEGLHDELRPASEGSPPALPGQLALWVVDGDGLPPRPWRLSPDDVFNCITLGCRMSVRECVRRQMVTDAQRMDQGGRKSQWASRGQGGDFPSCDTKKCAQGRGNRQALAPAAGVEWKGAGPGGRCLPERPRAEREAQKAARMKLGRVGLLDELRVLDLSEDPSPESERAGPTRAVEG
jgi:hypothetical protein